MTAFKTLLLTGLASSALIASTAHAQETIPSDTDGNASDIVVTGSRIARPETQSTMPISVTRSEDMIALGSITATDMLAMDPALGVGTSLASASTGINAGIQAINLRNLGTNRSLVLIDGQRRVSASATSSAVDIGMIPAGMIDRIEVITGGAAAIYGADAVTGAVNIITKRNVTGLNITATNGMSQRGDARESLASFSTGGKFLDGRLSVSIGGSWSETTPLYYTDRYQAGQALEFRVNPANKGPNDGIPDRIFMEQSHQILYDYRPHFFSGGHHYIYENGGLRIGDYATAIDAKPAWNDHGEGGDGRTTQDVAMFRGHNVSKSLMGRYDFAVTNSVTYGGYFSWAQQNYEGHDGSASIWRDDERTTFFGGAGGSIAYLDNPYLPEPVRQFMITNKLTKLDIERSYGNFPQRVNTHDRNSFTIGQTLEGKLTDKVQWGLFFQYGRTHDNETQGPVPWKDHWLAARDVIADPVTGLPVCRNAVARAAGCLPLNIFSTEPASQALIDYAMASRHNERTNSQTIFGGSINGTLISLPYGDVSVAAGVERRIDKLHTTDDPLALSGQLVHQFALDPEPPLNVSSGVTEEYAELVLPLLKDIPFIRHLEIEGAYRHSDYSSIGGTDTWKGGGTWSPIDGLTFRAVRSRSVRTPNFSELYYPQSTTPTGSSNDPCEVGQYYANDTRAKNCAALGIAAPLTHYSIGPAVTSGGNPDLEPETSNSLTVGGIFQPGFLPGFVMTVDYYNITIDGAIQQLSNTTLQQLCVDLPTIDNPFCARLTRDPVTHNVIASLSNQSNTARLYTHGIDIGLDYRHRLGVGQLRLSFKGNYLIDFVTETTPGVPAGDVISDGGIHNPRVKASLLTAYNIGKFDLAVATRFISATTYDLTQVGNPEAFPNSNKVPAMLYNDLSVQYRLNEKYRIGLGVKNIADTKPPYSPNTYTDSEMYDLVGRYFYITVNAKI